MSSKKYEIQKLHQAEFFVEKVLMLFAAVSVLTTAIIIFILFEETIVFFSEVPLWDFFTGTQWTPTLQPRSFGIIPLVVGTLMIALGSSIIALPLGLGSAIYLSEYAHKKVRKVVKPMGRRVPVKATRWVSRGMLQPRRDGTKWPRAARIRL